MGVGVQLHLLACGVGSMYLYVVWGPCTCACMWYGVHVLVCGMGSMYMCLYVVWGPCTCACMWYGVHVSMWYGVNPYCNMYQFILCTYH